MTDTYRPGQCNIGPTERRRRRLVGAAGALATVALVLALDALAAPPWTLAATAVPLFVTALGALQARRAFCVGFAARSTYDLGAGRGSVTAAADRAADAAAARRLLRDAAVLAGLGAALLTLGVPLL